MRTAKTFLFAAILLVFAVWVCPAQPGAGTVTITYTLYHIPRIASNQLAVWIEDAEGGYVQTLFATDFMARREGFRKRPQVCPEWVQAAGLERLSRAPVDAVSGATQKPGTITLSWDCKDAAGESVPYGAYLYKVEGNICFEKRVLWTGRIVVCAAASASTATAQYLPDASAAAEGTLVEGVTARFKPLTGAGAQR
jgi:hypothetical protein